LQQAVAVVADMTIVGMEEQVVVRLVPKVLIMVAIMAVRKVQVAMQVHVQAVVPPQPQVQQGKEVMARYWMCQMAPVAAAAVGMAVVVVVRVVAVPLHAVAVAALATLTALPPVVCKMVFARAMVR
jgi:hypothetical protein